MSASQINCIPCENNCSACYNNSITKEQLLLHKKETKFSCNDCKKLFDYKGGYLIGVFNDQIGCAAYPTTVELIMESSRITPASHHSYTYRWVLCYKSNPLPVRNGKHYLDNIFICNECFKRNYVAKKNIGGFYPVELNIEGFDNDQIHNISYSSEYYDSDCGF